MAKLERTEGDYTYWSDGAVRYAEGNSRGKQRGSLAKRPPYASKRFDELAPSKHQELAVRGGRAKYANRKALVADAYAKALASHPDSRGEEDGLHMVAMAGVVQAADSDGGGAAVKAREQVIQEYTGGKQASTVVDARQVHITISPEVAGRLGSLAELLSDVEDE